MPWFWDPVTILRQIPLGLSNLLTSQDAAQPESPCLTPGTSAIKEQEFFGAVAAWIEAPQESQPDQSMRQVFKSGTTVIRCTFRVLPYKVHSRIPPVSVPEQEAGTKHH